MKIKPMLGEFALDGIEYIESSESRALVEHRVPGLAANYFQDMGAIPNAIVIAGTKYGDEARDAFLNGIRDIFNQAEPTTFVADINTATDITEVVIEDLQVAEMGGTPDGFRYLIKLRKYVEPPEPPATGLLDAGILDDALNVVNALEALDALASLPNLGNPTEPLRGALNGIKTATGGLDQTVNDVRDLFSREGTSTLAPQPGASPVSAPAAGASPVSTPTAGASPAPVPAAGAEPASAPTAGASPASAPAGTASPIATPAPAGGLSLDPADARLEGGAGPALQGMLEAPETAETARNLAGGIQDGTLAGILGHDSEAAKRLASAYGAQPAQLIPPGQDAALVLDPASPLTARPTILLRNGVSDDPARLGAALAEVGRTFALFQRKELAPCDSAASAVPVPNLVPSSFCHVSAAAPLAVAPAAEAIEPVAEANSPAQEVIKEASECKTTLEVGFVHFNNDRHVVMPEGPTPAPGTEAPGIGDDGLRVLARALAYAQQHPSREMLVVGHSDTTGAMQYNLQLSAWRSFSVFFVLQGQIHKDEWIQDALRNGGHADDWRTILRWIHTRFDLDCEASDPAHPNNAQDVKAIKGFQQGYNQEVDRLSQLGENPFSPGFANKIPPAQIGFVGLSTWQAFFDFYQRELMDLLKLSTYNELRAIQNQVKLVSPPTQGCGEFHSRDLAERESRRERGYPEENKPAQPKDRRVEILFFDPDETPPFDCHPTTDILKCDPLQCLLYKNQLFVQRELPLLGDKPATKIALVGVDLVRRDGTIVQGQRSFSPLLKEKARFRIQISDLPVPFEGALQVVISRQTDDGFGRVAILEEQVCSLAEKQMEIGVEWVGQTDRAVPRQLSARTTPNLNNKNTPMHLPLREMEEDDTVRHGIYVVERLELVEKDKVVLASDDPKDSGLVVPVVCTLFFRMSEFVASLGHFGIGDGTKFDAPYFAAIKEAIVKVVTGYYDDIGVRFETTQSEADSIGIRVDLIQIMGQFGAFPGGSSVEENGPGFVIKANIFAWCEKSFGVLLAPGDHFRAAVGPSSILFRNQDQNSDDSKVLNEVFGPLGVARDSGIVPPNPPKAAKPRTATAGRIEGQVTGLDAANTSVSVSAAGVIAITTTNPSVVPVQRAADIQRALNAFTNSVGFIVAHELGHCLGLVAKADPTKAKIDIPGKASVLSPLMGDDEGHNLSPQGSFMDPGETIRLRTLFTPGKRLAFRDSNRRYLLDCFPKQP